MLRFKKQTFWAVGLFLLWGVSGCGADAGELAVEDVSTADAALTVQMGDNYFGDAPDAPPIWTISAGETVAVTLHNQGGLRHNWAIVAAGAEVPTPFRKSNRSHTDVLLFDSGELSGGQNGTVAFQAPAAGRYQIICTVAGHYPSMQGTLLVQ